MNTRPVGRPAKHTEGKPKRKLVRLSTWDKAAITREAKAADQSVTDYLLEAIRHGIAGDLLPAVTRRAPARTVPPEDRTNLELGVPLSLLEDIETHCATYGLTFTDVVIGAWMHRANKDTEAAERSTGISGANTKNH